ncbi:MAG: hypothetical protein WC604_03520 [Candidatus Gracilibacteria bacterium]
MPELEIKSSETPGDSGVTWETEVIVQPATAVTQSRSWNAVKDVRTAVVVKMFLALRRGKPGEPDESGGFATFRVCRREGVEYSSNQEIMLFSTVFPTRLYSQYESDEVTDRLNLLNRARDRAVQSLERRGVRIEADGDAPEIDFSVEIAGEKTQPSQG